MMTHMKIPHKLKHNKETRGGKYGTSSRVERSNSNSFFKFEYESEQRRWIGEFLFRIWIRIRTRKGDMLCMYMHTCVDMYHDTVVLALHLLLKVLITVIVRSNWVSPNRCLCWDICKKTFHFFFPNPLPNPFLFLKNKKGCSWVAAGFWRCNRVFELIQMKTKQFIGNTKFLDSDISKKIVRVCKDPLLVVCRKSKLYLGNNLS